MMALIEMSEHKTEVEKTLTIVVVVKDDDSRLRSTMESLVKAKVEGRANVIIQNGGKTLGDDIMIRIQGDSSFRLYEEKDAGIYNAMNKAMLKVQSRWVMFLNAGDFLISSEALSGALSYLESEECRNTVVASFRYKRDESQKGVDAVPSLQLEYYVYGYVCHQGLVYFAEYLRNAPYDENYVFASDKVSFINMLKAARKVARCNLDLVEWSSEGVCRKNLEEFENEQKRIRKELFSQRQRFLGKLLVTMKRLNKLGAWR